MQRKRNVLNSPRLRELKNRRRLIFLKKSGLSLLLLVVLFGSLAYLLHLPGINIGKIAIAGNSIVSSEDIEGLARSELAGKYLWLVPKTNILFYPKSRVRTALADKFKRLENIEFAIKNNRILEISVSEREPLFTWCGKEPALAEKEQCYFLDITGFIFDEAPYFSGDVYFKFFGREGVADAARPEGSRFVPRNFASLIFLKDTISSLGLKPRALFLKPDGDAEIFLSGEQEPKIFVRADADMVKIGENLSAAMDTEPLKSRLAKEYSRLEYLDLRFDKKVVSKFSE